MIFIKKLVAYFYSIIRSIYIVFLNIFSKRETILYPEHKVNLYNRFRGRIILTRDPDGNERCVACNLCSAVCPVGCISLRKGENKSGRWYPKVFVINFSRCIFCGMCEESCPTAAIQLIPDFEMLEYKKKDLIYEKKDLLISGTGKYPEYNFYKHSGVDIYKIKIKEESTVDVKNLMP